MKLAVVLGGLLALTASARNIQTIPVWDPSVLDSKESKPVIEDSSRRTDSLETHGYKTMEITVGDGGTQVDQELRLSIMGRLTDSVYVEALLSDVGRKAGDQTTSTLREVDQIYFRVNAPFGFLHLGDLTWKDESLSLYSLDRSSLGAMAGVRGSLLGGTGEASGVFGTDEVEHFTKVFNGVSGQREGYSMDGSGSYIQVVPQSETVWLNGRKLSREKDYRMNYAGGLLDFTGSFMLTAEDEIRIEFDAYEDENIYTLYGAQGHYRHENLWLDVSGFRLENDVDRLKRGVWTDDDYKMLKADRGEEFVRDDSLGVLARPRRTDRGGARIRTQLDHRFYADVEFAFNREDTNTVSHEVKGPEGLALRWLVTSDSSSYLKTFPLALDVGGSRIQKGFDISKFQGSYSGWNSYHLRDQWDLSLKDSSSLDEDLLFDELGFRFRLGKNLLGSATWGYRRNEDESWNSSRTSFGLTHRNSDVASQFSLVRVASQQEDSKERYQALLSSEFLQGIFRPFGSMDGRYTEINDVDKVVYGKSAGGFGLYFENGEVKESVGGRMARRKGESYGKDWEDSLRASTWLQEVSYRNDFVTVNHLLQFDQIEENQSGKENNWAGNLDAQFGNEDLGLWGNTSYKVGLTEEQVYTAVYKAVAPGTGDVRYDSLTGTYIEGVDNGDFVYEGLGRNDSVGAVLSSDVSFELELRWNPGRFLGVKNGILRDITIGGSWNGEANDTTGKKLFFPPVTKSKLDRLTSGMISMEGLLEWEHPMGANLSYKPGVELDKKLSSISYYETIFSHFLEGGVPFGTDHLVSGSFLIQDEELSALSQWDWRVYDGSLKYRMDFLQSFYVQPAGRYRTGSGEDESGDDFEGELWEGSLRLGYKRLKKADAYAVFSVIQADTYGGTVPYQVMDGYSDGRTYRLELSVSLTVNDYFSMGGRYILRFGDAEENIFQKLSMEARASF
ncbi:hypothetical protein [Fibrobacter sp. UWEL]|uniref:hypothetical protein n=1 Tax=Fibrobacter sp. UWEL TaxID=1896209 RepID=UPI00092359E7|nr:hypothetical protein [Fibrobacter sp. UWEL]SHL33260.1 hypothetical protein SAMN05720468_12240 [Fibrobacter sp. UWEL]